MKHYTEKELLEIFDKKPNKEKVKILLNALDRKGSKNHRIFTAMGYSYSDTYDEVTYTKN